MEQVDRRVERVVSGVIWILVWLEGMFIRVERLDIRVRRGFPLLNPKSSLLNALPSGSKSKSKTKI